MNGVSNLSRARATTGFTSSWGLITLMVTEVSGVSRTGVARGRQRGTAAALLGVATGISLAGMATLIKACTNLLVQGPVTLMTSWQLYAPLAIGAVGWLPNQLAFQAGPLSESLPPSPWSIQSSRRILIGDWWACRMAAAAARPRRRGP